MIEADGQTPGTAPVRDYPTTGSTARIVGDDVGGAVVRGYVRTLVFWPHWWSAVIRLS